MGKKTEYISAEEALQMLMKATGKTRRQAKMALAEAARQGKVRTCVFDEETGERKDIPPEAWPIIN
jgi:hypothetical protein